MRCSTVAKKYNNTIMRHSRVVKKDTTSCDIVHGSNRSEIKGETIMRRSTVVKTDKAAISDVQKLKEVHCNLSGEGLPVARMST
jgi:hypothetical protein